MAEHSLFVTYMQFCVFNADVKNPFSIWTRRHISQGFAWRPDSSSFSTLSDNGETIFQIYREMSPLQFSNRVVQVPFDVGLAGIIEVASISDAFQVNLVPGLYTLRVSMLMSPSGGEVVRLEFLEGGDRSFRILVADPAIDLSTDLLIGADPAT
jgi:hypothetical protein